MCSLRGQSTGKPNHKSKFKPSSDEEKHRSSAESEEVTIIDTWGHKLRIRDQRGAREQTVWAQSGPEGNWGRKQQSRPAPGHRPAVTKTGDSRDGDCPRPSPAYG